MLKTNNTDNSGSKNLSKDQQYVSSEADRNGNDLDTKKDISPRADNAKNLDSLMGGLQSDLNKQGLLNIYFKQ